MSKSVQTACVLMLFGQFHTRTSKMELPTENLSELVIRLTLLTVQVVFSSITRGKLEERKASECPHCSALGVLECRSIGDISSTNNIPSATTTSLNWLSLDLVCPSRR